jgi:ketosteroid isomerase-like protein
MAAAEPTQIVETYLKAFEQGDFDRARSCLSDAFTYIGATARFNDPESFIENVWHVGQILHHIEIRKTFVDDNDVCSIMNFHVHLDERRSVPVVQWAKVEDGKIRTIEVFFDATEYTAMFSTR